MRIIIFLIRRIGLCLGLRVEPKQRLIQREIMSSTRDVFADLHFQRLRGRPRNFSAQAVEKEKSNLRRLVMRDGMEVEDVSFHCKRIIAEGGAIADVGDRFEFFLIYFKASDVDTICRQEFFVRRQVDGGHRVARTVSTARRRSCKHLKRPAQKLARSAHISRCNGIPDSAAGNNGSPSVRRRMHMNLESKFLAQRRQFVYIRAGIGSKAKIVSLVYLDRFQRIVENGASELACGQSREFTGKGKNQHCVDATMREPRKLLLLLSNQA